VTVDESVPGSAVLDGAEAPETSAAGLAARIQDTLIGPGITAQRVREHALLFAGWIGSRSLRPAETPRRPNLDGNNQHALRPSAADLTAALAHRRLRTAAGPRPPARGAGWGVLPIDASASLCHARRCPRGRVTSLLRRAADGGGPTSA